MTITPPELAGSIYEPPNKSSTMGLEQPQRAKASFPSPNHLRLVVVIGLMVLILVAVITASPYTNELLVLLGIIVGFYFGKEYARS